MLITKDTVARKDDKDFIDYDLEYILRTWSALIKKGNMGKNWRKTEDRRDTDGKKKDINVTWRGVTNLCRNLFSNLFKLQTTRALLCFLKTCFTREHKASSSRWSEKPEDER